MADNDVVLRIKVLTDATAAATGLKGAQRETSKFERGVGRMAKPAAAAGLAVAALAKVAVDAASDMQQAQGAVEAVFGRQAGAVEKMSERSATAMGLSSAEYLNYAALVGTAMQNAGMSVRESVEASDKVMQRGADLSALYGGTTAEAVEAINAAVARSEFDPLEKYGASLNMTAVNAELAAKGQDKLTGAALDTAKKQIILEQVFKKTSKAAGQYAREADSVAGQQQTATAEWKNAAAALGEVLLPVVADLTSKLADMARWASANKGTVQALAVGVAAFAAIILTLNAALKVAAIVQGAYNLVMIAGTNAALGTRVALAALAVQQAVLSAGTKVAAAAQWALNAALSANPIGLIIVAIIALAAAFVVAYKKSETFRNIVNAVWAAVKSGATAAWQWVKGAFDKIVGAGKTAFQWIKSNWGLLLATVLAGPFGLAVALIIKHWDKIKAATLAAFNAVKAYVVNAASSLVEGWMANVRRMVGAVGQVAGNVLGAYRDMVARIKGVFAGAGRWLFSVGVDIVRGLVDGIESVIGWVQDKVEALADKVPGWVKRKLGIASPSKVMAAIGKEVGLGLAMGIEAETTAVAQASQNIANLVNEEVSKTINAQMQRAAVQEALVRRDGETTKEYRANSKKRVQAAKAEDAAWRKVAAARANTLTARVVAQFKDEAAALDAVNAQRKVLAESLDQARQDAQAAADEMANYAASIRDAARAYGSLTSVKLEDDQAMDAGTLAAAMAERVNAVQSFANTLDALRSQGLSESVIQDLAKAGVEGGKAQADAIAAGGPAAIAAFNTMQNQLDTAANQLGTNTATAMYGAGVAASQALVDSLVLQQSQLDTLAATLAAQLAAAIEAALNAALKAATKGKKGRAGRGSSRVASPAVAAVSASLAPGVSGYAVTSRASSSSGGGVNITVNGAIDPESTARQIRRILTSHERRQGLVSA